MPEVLVVRVIGIADNNIHRDQVRAIPLFLIEVVLLGGRDISMIFCLSEGGRTKALIVHVSFEVE